MSLRWRGIPKPTIAMVHGYCIFGGWLIASTMDLVFASEDAMFLPSNLQFFTVPWELGVKKAKEVLFESRFLTAKEAQEYGFVNRVFPREKLEEETLAYARRVADTDPLRLATSKFLCNQAQDLMGYTNAAISGFQTYSIGILDSTPEQIEAMKHGKRRLDAVDLALKHSGAPEADRGR
jgi:enoyl-CoA hydratase